MKKFYAIADVVPPDCKYLTAGKEHEVLPRSPSYIHLFEIIDDDGECLTCVKYRSRHLNGGNWRIIEREVPTAEERVKELWRAHERW